MGQETQKTTTIHIKDFAKKTICDGHLYLSINEKKKFYVMKPGIFLDEAFVKKHAPLNTSFEYQTVVDENIILHFKSLFKELRYLQFEKDLRIKSVEIINYFQKVFSEPNHFLNFANACFDEFCQIPREEIVKMHETDMHLFRKALYSGAFAVIVGMTNDFYHYPMLRDFYNISFGLDIGLCDANYSYYVAAACNQENHAPGTGLNFLKEEKASESEIKVFLDHPTKSHELITKFKILSYSDLAEIALYQHELSSGGGFPRGVHKTQISTWEAIVILADAMVKISDEYYFEENVLGYFLGFESKKIEDLPIARVYKKSCQALNFVTGKRGTGT